MLQSEKSGGLDTVLLPLGRLGLSFSLPILPSLVKSHFPQWWGWHFAYQVTVAMECVLHQNKSRTFLSKQLTGLPYHYMDLKTNKTGSKTNAIGKVWQVPKSHVCTYQMASRSIPRYLFKKTENICPSENFSRNVYGHLFVIALNWKPSSWQSSCLSHLNAEIIGVCYYTWLILALLLPTHTNVHCDCLSFVFL